MNTLSIHFYWLIYFIVHCIVAFYSIVVYWLYWEAPCISTLIINLNWFEYHWGNSKDNCKFEWCDSLSYLLLSVSHFIHVFHYLVVSLSSPTALHFRLLVSPCSVPLHHWETKVPLNWIHGRMNKASHPSSNVWDIVVLTKVHWQKIRGGGTEQERDWWKERNIYIEGQKHSECKKKENP